MHWLVKNKVVIINNTDDDNIFQVCTMYHMPY